MVERDIEITRPGDNVALCVEAGFHVHRTGRALGCAGSLVGATPLNPHWLADFLRNQSRIGSGILGAVAPVAARAFKKHQADRVFWHLGDHR